MKHAWLIIVIGLVLEFYLMTEPAFLFSEPIIAEETIKENSENIITEEIIFEEEIDEINKKVYKIIEKEIFTKNIIIKTFYINNKYYFEFYYDKDSSINWKEKVKEYELYLDTDCEILLVQSDNPERIIKSYD